MIVQHTDKECKTKFSIGVEFKNLLYARWKAVKKGLKKNAIYYKIIAINVLCKDSK